MTPIEELKEEIAVVEMEIGFLRTARKSPNPKHSIAAGKIELRREEELNHLKAQLQSLLALAA